MDEVSSQHHMISGAWRNSGGDPGKDNGWMFVYKDGLRYLGEKKTINFEVVNIPTSANPQIETFCPKAPQPLPFQNTTKNNQEEQTINSKQQQHMGIPLGPLDKQSLLEASRARRVPTPIARTSKQHAFSPLRFSTHPTGASSRLGIRAWVRDRRAFFVE